ncbi:MAG: TIGR04086 family membrane protein [Clostridia bacterium]|nr:TIGR04086 family membrane protein [Clostridia bacterium]
MKNFKFILLGMACSTICTIIFLLIFSLVLVKNNINEKWIPIVIIALFGCSIFCGTTISTRKIQKNGAMYGLIIAALYLIIMYIISSIFTKEFSIEKQSVYMIISSLLLGSVGGIMGVNIK